MEVKVGRTLGRSQVVTVPGNVAAPTVRDVLSQPGTGVLMGAGREDSRSVIDMTGGGGGLNVVVDGNVSQLNTPVREGDFVRFATKVQGG